MYIIKKYKIDFEPFIPVSRRRRLQLSRPSPACPKTPTEVKIEAVTIWVEEERHSTWLFVIMIHAHANRASRNY